jgi:hypothetical protein
MSAAAACPPGGGEARVRPASMRATPTTPGSRLVLAALLALAHASWASAASSDAGVCSAEAVRAEELRAALTACDQRALSAHEQARTSAEQSAALARQLAQSQGTATACQTARDGLCAGIGDFGRWVIDGGGAPGGLGACLAPDVQARVAAQLGAWSRVEPQLQGLLQFEAGARDELPSAAGGGALPVERAVAQLLAGGDGRPPLFYRRVLLAALERVAPRSWRRLQATGRGGLDAWLAAPGPLDAGLVAEVRRSAIRPRDHDRAGPTLAAGLSLVQTYSELARCEQLPPSAPDCRRARQLEELIETTGPLVIQRREQLIWATDCRTLGPGAVLEWLQDLPPPHQATDGDSWGVIAESAFTKLYTCFLDDREAGASFPAWSSRVLPGPGQLTARALARLDLIRRRWADGGDEDRCARAVRALQTLPPPTSCALPRAGRDVLAAWMGREPRGGVRTPATLRACSDLLAAEWQGRTATVPSAFAQPPTASELVRAGATAPAVPTARLRALCGERRGGEAFPAEAGAVVRLAAMFGEAPEAAPWHFDLASGAPAEQQRYALVSQPGRWARRLFSAEGACDAIALDPARCDRCSSAEASAFFDCALSARLERRWAAWQRTLWLGLGLAAAALAGAAWGARWAGAWRRFGGWNRRLRHHLDSIGVVVRRPSHTALRPSGLQCIELELPATQAWERWGRRAVVCRAGGGAHLLERDVNAAALRARAGGAELALLAHDVGASPDLSAVRALLEWAGRGSRKAVQVLPVPVDRLHWLRGPEDLLDLVEQTSLRGNPFEVRGRITSASQFFDRERIVSGLLAGVQAGSWTFVGGLRRFGKSSLALEVARRLPGPSGYVDLAGFYHEIAFSEDPALAADAILRYLSNRLCESFLARYGQGTPAPAPLPAGALDSGQVAEWFRGFAAAAAAGEGHRATSILLTFDELEQALAVAPERLPHALDVLSILVGRLRAAFGDQGTGAARIGVLLCGTMHPLLWAPLPALTGQSILGSLQTVFLPGLPDDAAEAMMRGLGARQGIRFTPEALSLVVREAQGIALLVRRIGSSVLELYDPERARQGSLGAVEIGIEGATAAVHREEEEGSPLRVWVESEIADPQTPPGALLRALARAGRLESAELRRQALALVARHFEATGIDRLLEPEERRRRLHEAAAVTVRLLGETGLLAPEGDLTNPGAYVFRDGIVRRILASARGGSPFALG